MNIHGTLASLEAAMKADDREHVAPSMCYAYAALAEGAPFIMGAPNTTVDIPAMWEMAEKTQLPIAGKDFKTGQTLVKSGFAPIIGTRCLGLAGWFSTNILGNRDGLVLDEPANFHTKEVSKLSTLESILVPDNQPDLYKDYYHKVRINYYPPRNDDKEGWDNIDIFGWMGYPMQIKINFLCRDSILAAPLCLDLVLLSDLAARAGRWGTQRFLSSSLRARNTTTQRVRFQLTIYSNNTLCLRMLSAKWVVTKQTKKLINIISKHYMALLQLFAGVFF